MTSARATTNISLTGTLKCVICTHEHSIYKCGEFLKLGVQERIKRVRELGLCWNCLKKGHNARDCKQDRCFICKRSHNKLLHVKEVAKEHSVTTHCRANENAQVMLTTAVVNLVSNAGKDVRARALLDVGADSNFVTKSLIEKLGNRETNRVSVSITGMGGKVTTVNEKVNLSFKSVHNSFAAKLDFLIINKITNSLPVVKINKTHLQLPKNIKLADPRFDIPGDIDLLLGAEIFYELLTHEKIALGEGTILQGSRLGWLVTGKVGINTTEDRTCNLSIREREDIHKQLEKFWNIEEIETEKLYSPEEIRCELNFVQHVRRDIDNHFVVNLPLKEKCALGNSKEIALRRFYCLEKRLDKDKKLKMEYARFLKEYEDLGHMEECKENEECNVGKVHEQLRPYYIPHHPVIKNTSSTTKVRVVFDASCKTTNGRSLNDILMVGPVIQSDLYSILIRFRTHNVVLIGDIEKMYRQVRVDSNFRALQLILWRENAGMPIRTFRLGTLTYGTAPASFLATRCLKELAIENSGRFPEEAEIILKDFYMDDLITGGKDLETVIELKNNISEILNKGGFKLRKFASNKQEILGDNTEAEKHTLRDSTEARTLGVQWDSREDVFEFHSDASWTERDDITKREVLSIIARIFDPLGLIQPTMITLKIFLQDLWKRGIGWDEGIPDDLKREWLALERAIRDLKDVKIPRAVLQSEWIRLELHGFSDASEQAYGAVVYVRTVNDQNKVQVSLLCSKSKVAPIKRLTLPRLELVGALLLAKLMNSVRSNIKLNFNAVHYWTDSCIVLDWLNGDPSRWKTFVSNRITKIQDLSDVCQWHHVSGKSNPADIVSRGTKAIREIPEWLSGPSFLYDEPFVIKHPRDAFCLNVEELKEREVTVCVQITNDFLHSVISRFSSVTKLKRVTAWILRFVNNARGKRERGKLKIYELNNAINVWIRLVQRESFEREIGQLKKGEGVSINSRLISLCPFLDKDGLIRVGGRLGRSALTYDVKYPIVLPKNHKLTQMLIQAEHLKLLHAGPQAVLASLRQHYWPLSGRDSVRNVLRKCIVCFKAQPVSESVLMGDLPGARLRPVRPFYNSSVDYAGPFFIKDGKLRNRKMIKVYLCVFVCFVTRAVHLELTTELSTSSFLQVLNRFIARRGIPNSMYSDNGTNFVGAHRELKAIKINLKNIAKDDMWTAHLAETGIQWYFMPARSPHMGGLHEAAVKSAKRHLLRVVGDAKLTYEQFYTIVCQVEGIMNSRPLFPCSNDPTDLSVLTPGHFLIGDHLKAVPNGPGMMSTCKMKDYIRLQQLTSHFWKRWYREYLHTLQQRGKWQRQKASSIKKGAMVLLRDDNIPTQQWRLGRIRECFPGKDGQIRVVDVQTTTGVTRRAVTTICQLPMEGESER